MLPLKFGAYVICIKLVVSKERRFGEDVVVDHWSSLMKYDFQGCQNQNLTLDQRVEENTDCVHDTDHKILFKILCLYKHIK